jgi:sRNA-binding carbon storage regulator CsrA
MPLKLMMEQSDKVLIGEDCILEVLRTGSKVQISLNAPPDVKIIHLHTDPEKQWKNRRKAWAEQQGEE